MPREAVGVLYLQVFKTKLAEPLNDLCWWEVSLPWQGVGAG